MFPFDYVIMRQSSPVNNNAYIFGIFNNGSFEAHKTQPIDIEGAWSYLIMKKKSDHSFLEVYVATVLVAAWRQQLTPEGRWYPR